MDATRVEADIKPGFAFYFNTRPGENHMRFVASKPNEDGRVVLLNITSWRNFRTDDDSCTFVAGDHPEITRLSYVPYNRAEPYLAQDLRRFARNGNITVKQPVSVPMLAKAWDGAATSPNCPGWVLDTFKSQGCYPKV